MVTNKGVGKSKIGGELKITTVIQNGELAPPILDLQQRW